MLGQENASVSLAYAVISNYSSDYYGTKRGVNPVNLSSATVSYTQCVDQSK